MHNLARVDNMHHSYNHMNAKYSFRTLLGFFAIGLALASNLVAQDEDTSNQEDPDSRRAVESDPESPSVYVVPITGQISDPQLFILRRALKLAIESEVDTLILELDTPGGAVNTTLEIMEALDRFNGTTIAFVNDEAISAGSFIASANDRIYMTETAVIGAAEVVMGTGEDVPEAMKRKVESYIQAKVRSLSDEYRYRGDVIRAMSDPDFVLEIEGEILKPAGELLTLTGKEAVTAYGEPPVNLLADGLHEDVESLLDSIYGVGQYQIVDFEITWSEELAKYLATISPALLGIGLLLIFIEFKTPGFGIFGIGGIVMLLIVFAANYVAGLAGYEEVMVFIFGILLILVDLIFLPGIFVLGIIGLMMIFGSLVWAMADVWPSGSNFTLTPEIFYLPLFNTFAGLIFGVVGIVLIARYLPRKWMMNGIILGSSVGKSSSSIPVFDDYPGESGEVPAGSVDQNQDGLPDVGSEGEAVTDLFPSGEIEVAGHRYQASTAYTQIEKGARVKVVGKRDYALLVEEM